MKPSSITGGSAQESSQSSNRQGRGAGKGKGQSSDSDDDFEEGKKSMTKSPEKNEVASQPIELKESNLISVQTLGLEDGGDADMEEENKDEEQLPVSTPLIMGQNSLVQVLNRPDENENKESGDAPGENVDMKEEGVEPQ